MDSFELNKILGAVLATCLVLLVSSFTAGAIFAPTKLEKPGYDIAVKEDDHAGGAKEAAAPAEPIEKLLQTASAEKAPLRRRNARRVIPLRRAVPTALARTCTAPSMKRRAKAKAGSISRLP